MRDRTSSWSTLSVGHRCCSPLGASRRKDQLGDVDQMRHVGVDPLGAVDHASEAALGGIPSDRSGRRQRKLRRADAYECCKQL